MPSAIVTTTYRYKRPPRKKKPIVLTGSATPPPKRKAHKPASDPQVSFNSQQRVYSIRISSVHAINSDHGLIPDPTA